MLLVTVAPTPVTEPSEVAWARAPAFDVVTFHAANAGTATARTAAAPRATVVPRDRLFISCSLP